MRTVSEIVEAVQTGQPATDEELRLALLCLFYHGQASACPSDYATASAARLQMRAMENFELHFRMMRAEPDKYLGARWTPGTDENLKGRAQSEAILKAFERSRAK